MYAFLSSGIEVDRRSVSGHDVSENCCSRFFFDLCPGLVRAMKLPGVRSQTMIHRQIIRTVFLTSQEKNTCTYWMVYAVASFDRALKGQRVFCEF